MCIFFKSLYFQMRACERVSSHLHLIADEAAVAAEFRFRFYSPSSADLRQWSVWASMPLKTFFGLVHAKKGHFVLQERENKQKCARQWQRWHSIFDCSEEESGKKNKDFGDSWHNTHTHACTRARARAHTCFLGIGCFWESEVMFLVPSRKRATLQVPFQLSLRDR